MLMVIVILFFLCWTPIFSVNAWRAFDTASADQRLSGAPISFIHLLSYTSACVNPIIYCFMNKRFRMAFLATFTCCAKQKPPAIRGEVADEEEGKTTGASLSRCSYTHMSASVPPWAVSEEAVSGLQKFKYLPSGLGKWLWHQLNMILFRGNESLQLIVNAVRILWEMDAITAWALYHFLFKNTKEEEGS